MRIITTGCMALGYTMEMQSFAVHLSAQCRMTPMVTWDRILGTPGPQVLYLLRLLPHLVPLHLCRTLEAALKTLHRDPELRVHGQHMITSTQETQKLWTWLTQPRAR